MVNAPPSGDLRDALPLLGVDHTVAPRDLYQWNNMQQRRTGRVVSEILQLEQNLPIDDAGCRAELVELPFRYQAASPLPEQFPVEITEKLVFL